MPKSTVHHRGRASRTSSSKNSSRSAKAFIAKTEHIHLSERDSLRVLDALENPLKPNAKLRAAARALKS